MSEIMRKNLARVYVCFRTESLHLPPDVGSADWLSGSCYEHTSFRYLLFRYIPHQFLSEFLRQKDRSRLSFHRNYGFPVFQRLHRYIRKLTDSDARAADRLQDQAEPFIMLFLCCTAEPFIFGPRQFLLLRAEDLLLYFQRFYLHIGPTEKTEQTVQTCQHGVDTSDCVTIFQ